MKTMILNAFGTITEGKVNVGSDITFLCDDLQQTFRISYHSEIAMLDE